MKFAVYSRKSVYTGKGNSVENQIEMCRQRIFYKYPKTKEEDITVYEDEGFSGKNIKRPQFQKLLADLKQDKINCLVCYRLDRISRSVSDFSAILEDLSEREISFISVSEDFDTSTPMGKAMIYIASVFAQLERETIAERVRDNMLMLARLGNWLGGPPPTGFDLEKVKEKFVDETDGKEKQVCRLKTNPQEIKVVELIFKTYLETRSVNRVSKVLIEKGIKARNGKFYSLPGIHDILRNPIYCIADINAHDYFTQAEYCFEKNECSEKYGVFSYNKRDYRKKDKKRQDIDKWIVAVGRHKGIISGKKWVQVQNILKENKPDGKQLVQYNDYALLSGTIICSKCKSKMFAKIRSGKTGNPNLFDYICDHKMRGNTALCDCPNLPGYETDDKICEHLMQYADEGSEIYGKLERLRAEIKSKTNINPIDEIETKIKKGNIEIDNLINTLAQDNLHGTIIKRINESVSEKESELKLLNEELERLKKSNEAADRRETEIDLLIDLLANLKANYKIMTVIEKRILIKILVDRIEWDGENLNIFIYGR